MRSRASLQDISAECFALIRSEQFAHVAAVAALPVGIRYRSWRKLIQLAERSTYLASVLIGINSDLAPGGVQGRDSAAVWVHSGAERLGTGAGGTAGEGSGELSAADAVFDSVTKTAAGGLA